MARIRPFRGLRYTAGAGDLEPLLAPPSTLLTPAERDRYVVRSLYNAVALAQPEGHGDDRSKFVRYARAAAHVAEWRRSDLLAVEDRPAFYRLVQKFGASPNVRTTLFAVAEPNDHLLVAEAANPTLREERLRLLEATRTVFEPTVALYQDPTGAAKQALAAAKSSAETVGGLDGLATSLERIDDPEAIAAIEDAFRDVTALLADNVEGYEAAVAFPGGTGVLLALTSIDDPAYVRLAVHRVVRRLPGGREGAVARLGGLFEVEEHHNRNLIRYVDRASDEGRAAFGMATEGGIGYLLTPKAAITGSAAVWLQEHVLGPIFGASASDGSLAFTDPIQAVRAADEGAAAAFVLPRPASTEVQDAARAGTPLPSRSAQTYPAVPTGLVYWSMGDDI